MDTADTGNRPFVTIRATSITATTVIDTSAGWGNELTPFVINATIPFHCSAAGNAKWSESRERRSGTTGRPSGAASRPDLLVGQ